METVTEDGNAILACGDCLDLMPLLGDGIVDTIITDPPYGLSFMGKEWDHGVPGVPFWQAALAVAKPGAMLLAFGGTRTFHRLTIAIEDAGWEIRDVMMWLYGSGFPKSHSVDKAIQKSIQSRYGNLQCDCVDKGDGCSIGNNGGCEGMEGVGVFRTSCISEETGIGDSDVSIEIGGSSNPVCELREGDETKIERLSEIKETVLLDGMCGGGAENKGLGHAPIRSGVEEPSGGNKEKRSCVSSMQEDTERKRVRVACTPLEAVPVCGDKSCEKSSGPVRCVSPSHRSNNYSGPGVDPNRCNPRRIILDDFGGRQNPVARVCSWCGFPDKKENRDFDHHGTALKPAWEPIIVAMKPLDGTFAENAQTHGVAGLNIDGGRIECEPIHTTRNIALGSSSGGIYSRADVPGVFNSHPNGRWPANVILDEEAGAMLDETTAHLKGGVAVNRNKDKDTHSGNTVYAKRNQVTYDSGFGDSGGASRFFYCAKSSKSERNGAGENNHPTVKPLALMEYLCNLTKTPTGGIVLDPFMGSGSTGVGALRTGRQFIGMELNQEYFEIAKRRIGEK